MTEIEMPWVPIDEVALLLGKSVDEALALVETIAQAGLGRLSEDRRSFQFGPGGLDAADEAMQRMGPDEADPMVDRMTARAERFGIVDEELGAEVSEEMRRRARGEL
jgi:hypothetical protein